MIVTTLRNSLIALVASFTSIASAGDLTKEECVDAHSRGQDAKEQGKLSLARKLFLTCAQAACPGLVQGDCARFANDLSQLQPSVSFVARDGAGTDLPDTTVYIDDVLVATRLDDGTVHDIDPGKHAIRFSNSGHDQIVTVVIGGGEKGRTVMARFGAPSAISPTVTATVTPKSQPAQPRAAPVAHPLGARVLLVGGAALAIGGGVLGVVELTRLPSNCSISTHQCAAAPGDPSFADAAHAVRMSDIGWAVGAAGVAAVAGGWLWYVAGPKAAKDHLALAPWLAPGSGGLALSGSL